MLYLGDPCERQHAFGYGSQGSCTFALCRLDRVLDTSVRPVDMTHKSSSQLGGKCSLLLNDFIAWNYQRPIVGLSMLNLSTCPLANGCWVLQFYELTASYGYIIFIMFLVLIGLRLGLAGFQGLVERLPCLLWHVLVQDCKPERLDLVP